MLHSEVENTLEPGRSVADAVPAVVDGIGKADKEVFQEPVVFAGDVGHADAPLVEIPPNYTDWVLRLLHRLRRKRMFRNLAADPSSAVRLAPDDINGLIALLSKADSNRWREQVVACWALGKAECENEAVKQAAVRTLCAVLDKTVARRLRRNRKIAPPGFSKRTRNAIVWCALFGLAFAYPVNRLESDPTNPQMATLEMLRVWLLCATCLSFLAAPIITPISIALDMARNKRIRTAAAWALGRLPSVVSIEALAAASVESSAKLRQAATASLQGALPLLTPEHYGQLPSDTVPSLCRAMNTIDNWFFGPAWIDQGVRLRIHEALEKIGDGRAIPHVESLARSAGSQAVRDAAQRLLPILEERRQRDNNANMLLRASDTAVTSADQLLRAATGAATETPADELMRPSTEPTDGVQRVG